MPSSNAQNLNFNSGNANMNNNNRKNGFSVRAVKSTCLLSIKGQCILIKCDELPMSYRMTFEELLSDLHVAYIDARRHYVSNATLRRMERKVTTLSDEPAPERLRSRLNSMLGLLSHYRSYRIRRHVFYE